MKAKRGAISGPKSRAHGWFGVQPLPLGFLVAVWKNTAPVFCWKNRCGAATARQSERRRCLERKPFMGRQWLNTSNVPSPWNCGGAVRVRPSQNGHISKGHGVRPLGIENAARNLLVGMKTCMRRPRFENNFYDAMFGREHGVGSQRLKQRNGR